MITLSAKRDVTTLIEGIAVFTVMFLMGIDIDPILDALF